MTQFSWLHLTDFHCGMAGQPSLWPTIKEEFLEDLTDLHEETGPWDWVIFTGDIAQCGKEDEFKEAQRILGEIWQCIEALGSRPVLLAVPGNHDLVRPDADLPAVRLLELWERDARTLTELLEKRGSDVRKVVDDAFANYTEWWEKNPYRPRDGITRGLLPGDFSVTMEKDGCRVGILGLNTTFLQLTNRTDYEGHLAVDLRQFDGACGREGPAWAAAHHSCLLLTHQPREWLAPRALSQLNEIDREGRFAAHLFGHMHENRDVSFAEGGSLPSNRLQGRSLFSMEKLDRNGEKVERLHGYAIHRLECGEGGGFLKVWPRRALEERPGTWLMQPHVTSRFVKRHGHTRPRQIELRALGRPKVGPAPSPAFPPPPSPRSLGRRASSAVELAEALEAARTGEKFALWGPEGIGKSFLANRLRPSPPVARTFGDRILFTGVGHPRPWGPVMERLERARGLPDDMAQAHPAWPPGTRPPGRPPDARMLLVVESAGSQDSTEQQLLLQSPDLGQHCTPLLVTTSEEDARRFAIPGRVFEAQPPQEEEAAGIIEARLELDAEALRPHQAAIRELAVQAGHFPLTLVLIGSSLRRALRAGTPATKAIAGMDEVVRQAVRPGDDPAAQALRAVVSYCVGKLKPAEQRALHALSVFKAKPNSFSALAAYEVMQAGPCMLRDLVGSGLVEDWGWSRYALHPVVDSVAACLPFPARVKAESTRRMIQHFVHFAEANGANYPALSAEEANINASLEEAYERRAEDTQYGQLLLRGSRHVSGFLLACGRNEDGRRHLGRALGEMDRSGAAAYGSLGAELALQRATHFEKLGQYDEARSFLLSYAADRYAHHLDRRRQADILYVLGIVLFNRDQLDEAQEQIDRGLRLLEVPPDDLDSIRIARRSNIAERPEEWPIVCDLLERRCLVQKALALRLPTSSPKAIEAQEAARRSAVLGLDLARRLGDHTRLAIHLLNRAWLLLDEGKLRLDEGRPQLAERQYKRVFSFARPGLVLAQEIGRYNLTSTARIGHPELEAGFLHRLGAASRGLASARPPDDAMRGAALAEAEERLARGLGIARVIQHQWYEALLGVELGHTHLDQGKAGAALRVFRAAREKAAAIRSRDLESKASKGIAEAQDMGA